MNKITVLLLMLLTSSCGMLPEHKPVTIKERLPVGAILNLTKSLVIPKDRSSIYIANGKVAPIKNFNTIDVYDPYCLFRLHDEVKQAHQILPDQFKVTKIVEWEGYYSLNNYKKYVHQYDDSKGLIKVGAFNYGPGFDTGPSIIMYATIISIHSNQQPEVNELVCGHWDEKSLVEPLTLEEMKKALGNLITIASELI